MANFASPFFQTQTSLLENCVRAPSVSTYTGDYRHPKENVQVEKEKRAARDPRANTLCKKATAAEMSCRKVITNYLIDYRNPFDPNSLDQVFARKYCPLVEQKEEPKPEPDIKSISEIKVKSPKEKTPDWKKEGWKLKRLCWIHPLEERLYYGYEDLLRCKCKLTKCIVHRCREDVRQKRNCICECGRKVDDPCKKEEKINDLRTECKQT